MELRRSGQVGIVTGAGREIGRAIAEVLAADIGVDLAEASRRTVGAMGTARSGEPAEIARAVAFLASPQAGYCQGTILDVDGGQNRALSGRRQARPRSRVRGE